MERTITSLSSPYHMRHRRYDISLGLPLKCGRDIKEGTPFVGIIPNSSHPNISPVASQSPY